MSILARLAAGAIVIVATVLASKVILGDEPKFSPSGEPEAPAEIQAAVSGLFVEGRCTTAAEAEDRLPATLSDLGQAEWGVDIEGDVAPDDCVTSATLALEKRILLVKALRPEVDAALDGLTNYTLDHCLGEDEAIEFVTARLDALGESEYEIDTDGMLVAPVERWDHAVRHYEAGCYVFSGTGRDAEGVRVYYVTGR